MEIIHPLQQAAGRQQEGEAVRVLACYRLSKGLQTTVGHFVNKVLLEHSQPHLFTYCPWLLSYTTRVELWAGDMAQAVECLLRNPEFKLSGFKKQNNFSWC
jgi:hypothetical protein